METQNVNKLKPFKEVLTKTCERLFIDGTPTTQFMRSFNMVIQFHANVDIPSPDDFYCRSKNQEMIEVMKWLGFDSTPFGICHSTTQKK